MWEGSRDGWQEELEETVWLRFFSQTLALKKSRTWAAEILNPVLYPGRLGFFQKYRRPGARLEIFLGQCLPEDSCLSHDSSKREEGNCGWRSQHVGARWWIFFWRGAIKHECGQNALFLCPTWPQTVSLSAFITTHIFFWGRGSCVLLCRIRVGWGGHAGQRHVHTCMHTQRILRKNSFFCTCNMAQNLFYCGCR